MRDHHSIRKGFLDYFAANGHEIVSSHSLIPPADPTLLFVNAGMVQFKDVFSGAKKVPYVRATTSQKCLRVSGKHNDLENVGRTPRHHTFFEMLGNFSFGDYFKKDAIRFGWQFLTEVAGLPKDRLWVTIHPSDDEAYGYWRNDQHVPAERIVRDPNNVWSMGDTGPNGPCSEIHWDRGESWDPGVTFAAGYEGNRYLELWNLVFMQFDKAADGTVTPLPRPSIDTGAGLERIASVLQGVDSNYDTDLFSPLIAIAAADAGRPYRANPDDDVALRVIADHARATAFLIADGIYPENEGRGYVLRRIMRRAIRFGRKLGLEREFFYKVVDGVVTHMGDAYPELVDKRRILEQYVRAEEERFGRTLSEGLELLDRAITKKLDGPADGSGERILDGDVVFKLCDTHGFPLDLTRLIAEEKGVRVDEAGFECAMQAQRERGRASWKEKGGAGTWADEATKQGLTTSFVGYETETAEARIVAAYHSGRGPEPDPDDLPFPLRLRSGHSYYVVTDRTPFYGESGGQVGDQGLLRGPSGEARVLTTEKTASGLVAHLVEVTAGSLEREQVVTLVVDHALRAATRRHHTSTHLLQNALRTVLGAHVKQRGSLVGPERLRFDFGHFGPMTPEELRAVEVHVNELITANHAVTTTEKPIEQALKDGAIAFFEEKYADVVRVVDVGGGVSVELCGGTHVTRTGDIGAFVILSEGGVSSGVRRIEALAGAAAVRWLHEQRQVLADVRAAFQGVATEQLVGRVADLQRELKAAETLAAQLRTKLAASSLDDDLAAGRRHGDVLAVVKVTDGLSMNEVGELTDRLREKLTSGVVFIANKAEGGAVQLMVATKEAPRLHAGKLLGVLAAAAGGKGGGRPDMARGGAPDASRLDLAIEAFHRAVSEGIVG